MFKKKAFFIILFSVVIFSLLSLACLAGAIQQTPTTIPDKIAPGEAITETTEPGPPQAVPSTTSESFKPQPTATLVKSEPIVIAKQGFGQDKQVLAYGFIVENPNPNVAFEDVDYQVAVYNPEGTVVETATGYIGLILPGQKLGIAETMYLDEGVTAAKIYIKTDPGNARQSDLSERLTVDKVAYLPGEYSSEVRGLITNTSGEDVSYLRVSALTYNESDDIIGGGSTYLNFINANSSMGVSVLVYTNGDVSRVDIYPALSGRYSLEQVEKVPDGAKDIVLSKFGFGQKDAQLSYGLIIENPNQDYAIEASLFHVTAFAEDGSILGTTEGYVELLLPAQTLGVAGDIYHNDAEAVARIEVQIRHGNYTTSDPIALFSAENINYLADEYSPQVTGEIISPYNIDIENLQVYAIAYDEAGEIIGSGVTYLNFVPANSKSAVSIYITSTGQPAKVELYASVSSLEDLEGSE